ncbi:MAG: efflux RND transporter permease subunit [Planctomycetaceae bacterium]|jgi:HAE1 family hydrophobic/amphiphilic exporter-1|nr:efflux RND transporter permease subunit [Planctomycetaceae bacterium]
MDLIRFAIDNPVKVSVGILLTVLFGFLSFGAIPIQLIPDVERPLVTVTTSWLGRSPEEVEQSILFEQEKKLKTIQGLYKMTSTARLGQANISLEFQIGSNIDRAVQDVAALLDEVPSYPDDVDRPVIRASSAESDEAIAYAIISSGDRNYDIAEFFDYADRYIIPVLERTKGLSQVDIYGGRVHEVQVRFDPKILVLNGISVEDLRNVLRADNVNESAGDMGNGRVDMRFRVLGRFESLEPIRRTIVKFDGNSPVYVEDIAEVKLVLTKRTFFDQSRGRTTMTMAFKRETGSNVLSVMNQVKRVLAEVQEDGGVIKSFENDQHKIRIDLIYDDSTYIMSAVGIVQENMFSGGLLAIAVLLLFLRSTRPTFVIALAIPISVVGTFIIMFVSGRNINVISLAGITFAVGMVVDNAIVVLENIDRHLHQGKSPSKAGYDGTREVWGAVLASTLTTVAVFVPVLTIQEEAGQLFYDLALAICAAVLLSLLVSVTVIPAAAVRLLKDTSAKRSLFSQTMKSLFGIVPFFNLLNAGFAKLIRLLMFPSFESFCFRGMVVIFVSAVSIWLSLTVVPPASYLPSGNINRIIGNLTIPPSYSLSQNTTIGYRLNEILKPYWEAKTTEEASVQAKKDGIVDMRTGRPVEKVPPIAEMFMVLSSNRVFMTCTSKDPENVQLLTHVLNYATNSIPGCRGSASQASLFGRRAGNANSVQLEVIGTDMVRLRDSASYLEKRLIGKFSPASVRSSPGNYDLFGPETRIVINQVRSKELGISVQSIAASVRAMIDGIKVGDFNLDGDNIDLMIIRNPDILISPYEVENLPIAVSDTNSRTLTMPLSDLVHFVPADSSQEIRRLEQERSIQITVTPGVDVALEAAQSEIFSIIDQCREEGGITPEIRINLAGNADKLSQTRAAMIGRWSGWNMESLKSVGLSRFFLALLVTYLLMAALFESYVYPFVIMFTVPLATVGGFAGLAYVHALDPLQQFDTLSMLGFIILIGIVVNNAILIVHQSLNFMRGFGESEEDKIEPMSVQDAITESVRTRMRPIFMSTLTTIFGMIPLVQSTGAGSELYKGLGAVVVGGLTFSTVFTLLVTPLLLSMMIDLQNWLKAGFAKLRR